MKKKFTLDDNTFQELLDSKDTALMSSVIMEFIIDSYDYPLESKDLKQIGILLDNGVDVNHKVVHKQDRKLTTVMAEAVVRDHPGVNALLLEKLSADNRRLFEIGLRGLRIKAGKEPAPSDLVQYTDAFVANAGKRTQPANTNNEVKSVKSQDQQAPATSKSSESHTERDSEVEENKGKCVLC